MPERSSKIRNHYLIANIAYLALHSSPNNKKKRTPTEVYVGTDTDRRALKRKYQLSSTQVDNFRLSPANLSRRSLHPLNMRVHFIHARGTDFLGLDSLHGHLFIVQITIGVIVMRI